jgi:hypothetical protein
LRTAVRNLAPRTPSSSLSGTATVVMMVTMKVGSRDPVVECTRPWKFLPGRPTQRVHLIQRVLSQAAGREPYPSQVPSSATNRLNVSINGNYQPSHGTPPRAI